MCVTFYLLEERPWHLFLGKMNFHKLWELMLGSQQLILQYFFCWELFRTNKVACVFVFFFKTSIQDDIHSTFLIAQREFVVEWKKGDPPLTWISKVFVRCFFRVKNSQAHHFRNLCVYFFCVYFQQSGDSCWTRVFFVKWWTVLMWSSLKDIVDKILGTWDEYLRVSCFECLSPKKLMAHL